MSPVWKIPRLNPANAMFLGIALIGLAAFLFPFWAPANIDPSESRLGLVMLSGAVAAIMFAMVGEAQQGATVFAVAMIGTLVGLNTSLRVIETVIPIPSGFSPVFLLIALVGYSYGARLGFLMGSLTMLVSGPLTAGGLGPWTPYQMLAAGWMGMAAAWLPRKRRLLWLAVYSGIWGWIYGGLTNLHFWPYAISSPDLSWEPGLGLFETLRRYARFYLISSLGWDSVRAAGNVILILVLGPSLLKALQRFQLRSHIEWQTPPENPPSPINQH